MRPPGPAFRLTRRLKLPAGVLRPGTCSRLSGRGRLLGAVLAVLLGIGFARGVSAQAFNLGARLDFPTGFQPVRLAMGDLNGDGKPDLVVANLSSNSVSVLPGNGAGSFGAKTDFAAGSQPDAIAIGDLNGDGLPDLAITNNASNTVTLLFGNGLGGFGARTDLATGSNPVSVAIADLNGDARPDLVVTNEFSNTVSIFLASSGGGFSARTDIATGANPWMAAAADVNGDGRPDLIVTNSSAGSVSVLLGNGAGGFGPRTDFATGSGPLEVAVGDLNNDGRLDLVVASHGANTVSVLLGDGAGGFGPKSDFAGPTGPRSIAIADLNGDGHPDVVVGNDGTNSISVFAGNGAGGLTAWFDFATSSFAFSVAVGDVNGDGRPDIAVANSGSNTVSILLANLAFTARTDLATATFPYSVASGDFNGDGRADLAVSNLNSSSISVLLGAGGGNFGAKADFATGATPIALAVADFNGDGKPDLAVAEQGAAAVGVLLGTGTGTFPTRFDFATGVAPSAVAVADINGDGKPDLVTTNQNANTVSVLLNTTTIGSSTPTFSPKVDFATGLTPTGVAAADLNGDGKPDVMAVNDGANTVSVLLNTTPTGAPTPTFAAKVDYATANGSLGVATGDLNGDGRPDLVVANSLANNVSILLNSGTGTFGAHTDFLTGLNCNGVAIADLNGDGRLDVATANTSGTGLSILLGNGAGSFGPNNLIAVGSNPRTVALADFNGDGRLDVATANSGSNSASVLLGLELTRTSVTVSPNPVVLGQPITLTARTSVVAPGTGAPGDSVRFFDGTTLLGTAALNSSGAAALMPFTTALGTRSLTAVYKGDARFSPSLSAAVTDHVVQSASPHITSTRDVPSDQGGEVRLKFNGSGFDFAGSANPITGYYVYRQALTAAPGMLRARPLVQASRSGVRPTGAQFAGWDYLLTVAATADGPYQVVVPTLADSNGSGTHYTTFLVRAATSNPGTYYDSAPDSGYSVDNLPPAPPAPFTAAYASGATNLHWGANTEPDLWYYAVYRGSSADFVPGPSSRIATRSDTGYVDVGPAGSYYKLSAMDVNGNESGYALVGPNGTTAVPGPGSFAFALRGMKPNPATDGRISVSFELPDAAPARLELLDVSGRQVAAREVGALGAGRHELDIAAPRRLAPGLYLVRLVRGTAIRTSRVTVLE